MAALTDLINKVYVLKSQEDEAKRARIAAELELEEALAIPAQWEGSKTQAVDNFKVTVKRAFNTKVDSAKLTEIFDSHGYDGDIRNAFRWKAEVDKKKFEALNAEVQSTLNEAITKTPSKVSFTIKLKED